MNSVFSAKFMSPNLVFQQGISHHKNTLPPSMSLSTFEPSMVDSQSIINDQYKLFHTLKWNQMDLYNQYLIPTIYSHTAQQVGLNSFPPNSPVKLPSTVPTLPLHSEGHPLVRRFSHFRWACCRPEWRSQCRRKKESGRSDWAAGGRKSQGSANAWRFCGWDTIVYSIPLQETLGN